jgi:hypothetical protein
VAPSPKFQLYVVVPVQFDATAEPLKDTATPVVVVVGALAEQLSEHDAAQPDVVKLASEPVVTPSALLPTALK